jgi:hypothetical protein
MVSIVKVVRKVLDRVNVTECMHSPLYGNRIIAENIFVASKGTKRQEYEEN